MALKLWKAAGAGGVLWWSLGLILTGYVFMASILIIYRHPRRIDFTREEVNTLSPETLNRLSLIKDEVRVVLPVFFQVDNPEHDLQKEILLRARALLVEYMARQPRLSLEADLNLANARDAESWSRLCANHGLSPRQYNRFIFFTADGELRQAVTPDDLAVYDRSAGPGDRTPLKVRKFRAESAFTTALTRLIQRERRRVYAVEDHHEPGSRDETPLGMSYFRKELETNGFEVIPLRLREEPRIPGNCDVLLLAAPAAPLDVSERQKVNDFLLEGGRLLAAVGQADTGLEALLDSWGIRVQTGQVLERRARGPRSLWEPNFVAGDFNASHTISEGFQRGAFAVTFSNARALEFKGGEGLEGHHLLRTSKLIPSFLDRNMNKRQDEGEQVGQWVLAGLIDRPRPARPPPGYRHVDVRIVALGDSTPMLNLKFEVDSNREFLLNCLNWLTGREEQIAAGSTAWTERRLSWNPRIERFLFWVPVFLFPGIVLSFGTFVYFLRKA